MQKTRVTCDVCGRNNWDDNIKMCHVSIGVTNTPRGLFFSQQYCGHDVCVDCLKKLGFVPNPECQPAARHDIEDLIRGLISEELDSRA